MVYIERWSIWIGDLINGASDLQARKRAGQNDVSDNQEEERNDKEEIPLSELEEEEYG